VRQRLDEWGTEFSTTEFLLLLGFALGGGPVGFDFDRAGVVGEVVGEAAPLVLFGVGDEAALDGVSVDVTDDLGAGFFATDVFGRSNGTARTGDGSL